MELKEAIRILHPNTTANAIAEIQYYAGFDREKVIAKIDEAILCVIEAAQKQIPIAPKIRYKNMFSPGKGFKIEECKCGSSIYINRCDMYCRKCGQKLRR